MTIKIHKKSVVVILVIVLMGVVSCVSSPSTPQRMVSSVAVSAQTVEVVDVLSSLTADKSAKNEDQLKYKKIEIDSFEKLAQLKERLEQVQTKQDDLMSQFGLKKDYFRSVKVALQFIDELSNRRTAINELRSEGRFFDLVNILNALRNRSDSSKEESLEIITSPITLLEHLKKPEIVVPDSAVLALPVQAVASLSDENYSKELVRAPIFNSNQVCSYAGPKSGYGFKAGLKIQCGDQKLKLKFGPESHVGPFNSRLFRAMGALTPRIDFVSQIEMKYDRKFMTEFNSRKQTHTKVTLLGVKIKQKDWNSNFKDPLSYVSAIKMKDGSVLAGAELKQFKTDFVSVENNNFNINETLESKIDNVIFTEGSVIEDLDAIEVGPWRFDEPNHIANEVLRRQYILSIWVGNNDMPMNNTRLLITKETTTEKNKIVNVVPIYIDLGAGLGGSESISRLSVYDIENMSDSMSTAVSQQSTEASFDSQNKVIFNFISKTPTKLADKLTFTDTVAALNLMCRFKSEQIKAALLQSGIPEKLSEIAKNKLVHRRTKLIQDLQVQRQFAGCLN